MSFYEYTHYHQPTAAELQELARANAGKAAIKGERWDPVTVTGNKRQICTTWWGQAWCSNLERYADYSNRIERGKRYVRAGSVLDLKIKKGKVLAKVQGSRRTPYTVEIRMDPLDDQRLQMLMNSCVKKIDSLEDLMQGKFPKEMESIFLEKGVLFPTPAQIHFDCSCPDWAYMCKHVAAVMYAIGVRLDENPFYFFELRGLDAGTLVRKTVENKVEAMLAHAHDASPRILEDINVDALFAINDFDPGVSDPSSAPSQTPSD